MRRRDWPPTPRGSGRRRCQSCGPPGASPDRPEHLGVAADCERALGRPERALAYADDPDVPRLPQDQRVELVIVLAGARRDMGQFDAAVLVLQDPARRTTEKRPWAARLWYAYADALLAAGRPAEAREWFSRAAAVDVDGQTDAGDRLLELDGVVLEDPDGDEDEERHDLMSAEELEAYVQQVPVPAEGIAPQRAEGDVEPEGEQAAGTSEPTGSAGVLVTEPTAPEPRPAVPEVLVEAAPQETPVRPTSGVAPPPFVAEPDDELRLFE